MVRIQHVSKSFEKKSGERKRFFEKQEKAKLGVLDDVTIRIEDNQYKVIIKYVH